MFKHHTRIYLHHTDAAGRLFFANQFYLIHEAKEHFFDSIGFPIRNLLDHPEITFPLVHAESDYKSVLVAGDEIDIEVFVEKIGETSITFGFNIIRSNKNSSPVLAGTAKTVNVAVDKKTGKKVQLPSEWKQKLQNSLRKV